MPDMEKPVRVYREAFRKQRLDAKKRGINWCLTFDQWVEWWGEDIDNRGRGVNNLQMQRPADTGPYELGNIRKGYPKDNSKTYSATCANRRSAKAKEDHEKYLDALMFARSEESPDRLELGKFDYAKAMQENGIVKRAAFMADSSR